MSEKLEIVCPKCKKDNTVNLKKELHCKHCDEDLTDKTYIKDEDLTDKTSIKKICSNLTITIAFLTGVGSTIGGELLYFLKEMPATEKTSQRNASRYPINNEYLILNQCISEDQRPLERSYLEKKKDICICALEKTQKHYDFASYKQNESNFLDAFEKNADSCMEPSAAEEASPASAAY